MTTVVGIDPSITATGCAVWRDGHVTAVRTLKTDSKAIWQVRWRQIRQGIIDTTGRAELFDHVLFVIEQPPATFVGPAAALPNHGLYAILTDWWWSNGAPWVDVQPTQLKKFATGKGGGKDAGKEGVMLAIERRYGHLARISNNNEADAFALMAMGLYRYGQPLVPDLPAAHTEKLDNIPWPDWRMS